MNIGATPGDVPGDRLLELEAMALQPTQFVIPRRAALAIDFPALRRRGREAGLVHFGCEYNERSAGPSNTRITCRPPVALLLIEQLRTIADRAERAHDTYLLAAASLAIKSAFKRTRPSESEY